MKNKYTIFSWSIFVLAVFFLGFLFYLIGQGPDTYAYKTVKKTIKQSEAPITVEAPE